MFPFWTRMGPCCSLPHLCGVSLRAGQWQQWLVIGCTSQPMSALKSPFFFYRACLLLLLLLWCLCCVYWRPEGGSSFYYPKQEKQTFTCLVWMSSPSPWISCPAAPVFERVWFNWSDSVTRINWYIFIFWHSWLGGAHPQDKSLLQCQLVLPCCVKLNCTNKAMTFGRLVT